MPKGFVVNTHRFDPYKNFKFTVIMEGRPVMGISKVSALKRTTEVVRHRDGGDPSTDRTSPGRTTYPDLTMERGITHDPEFEKWANLVHALGGDALMDLKGYKRNLILQVHNEKGHVAKRYHLRNCWVSEYTLPDFDANANAVAIESIKITLEGWERDEETPEPDETSPVPASS